MAVRPNVLALDDDPRFLENLEFALKGRFDFRLTTKPAEALEILKNHRIDALLVDYDLGFDDGHKFIDRVREELGTCPPVIVVSGVVNLEMTIGFLKRRTFGFLQKPVSLPELEILLLEASQGFTGDAENFEIDRETRAVKFEGKGISLTPTEFEILLFFVHSSGKQVSRMTLITHLWGERSVSRNALDTHLLNLKKKLPPFARRLKSVYGAGYCYEE